MTKVHEKMQTKVEMKMAKALKDSNKSKNLIQYQIGDVVRVRTPPNIKKTAKSIPLYALKACMYLFLIIYTEGTYLIT